MQIIKSITIWNVHWVSAIRTYLARDVIEIAKITCHQSLVPLRSEDLLPLHFWGAHSGVMFHEEADSSRDSQPQLQRTIIQLQKRPYHTLQHTPRD